MAYFINSFLFIFYFFESLLLLKLLTDFSCGWSSISGIMHEFFHFLLLSCLFVCLLMLLFIWFLSLLSSVSFLLLKSFHLYATSVEFHLGFLQSMIKFMNSWVYYYLRICCSLSTSVLCAITCLDSSFVPMIPFMWNTLEASEIVLHLLTCPVHFLFEILGRHPYIISF